MVRRIPLLSSCSNCVFRAFKRFERSADRLTSELCTPSAPLDAQLILHRFDRPRRARLRRPGHCSDLLLRCYILRCGVDLDIPSLSIVALLLVRYSDQQLSGPYVLVSL